MGKIGSSGSSSATEQVQGQSGLREMPKREWGSQPIMGKGCISDGCFLICNYHTPVSTDSLVPFLKNVKPYLTSEVADF